MSSPWLPYFILWHRSGAGRFPPPNRASEETMRSSVIWKERGKMLSVGFFSGLVTQSEIDDLLDVLYGSYGERLIVSYKKAS